MRIGCLVHFTTLCELVSKLFANNKLCGRTMFVRSACKPM